MQIDFPTARKFLAISIIWLLNTALSANDFESFLKPIFAQSCYKCHGGEKVKGNSILGNTLEAIVGAIFLDSNYSKTKEILNLLFVKDFQKLKEDNEFKDPKSTLQELTQKKYRSLPLYTLSDSSLHKETNYFEVLCSIDKTNFEVHGKGNTRKGAELDAAQNMLELIKKDV